MPLGFRWALQSDVGTVRTNNEDSAFASPALLVLADGMGGHAGGEVASVVTTNRFARIDPTAGDIPTQITEAGRETRAALHAMSLADPALETMGTTAVMLACDGTDLLAGHIGDSRLYLLRGDELFQVTTDHTHVQYLVDSGQIHPDQVATHPYRAMLLRSLDDQPGGTDLDLIGVEASPGDRFLLCSDGLSDYVHVSTIGELLAAGTPAEAAASLVEAALADGTRDNVTVVVADVTEEPVDGEAAAGGAAADPLVLSPEAAEALGEVMPELLSGPRGDAVPPPDAEAVDDEGEAVGGSRPEESGIADAGGAGADSATVEDEDPALAGERESDESLAAPVGERESDDAPSGDAEVSESAATDSDEKAADAAEESATAGAVPESGARPEPDPITSITAAEPAPQEPRPGVPVGGILAAIAILVLGAAFVALL